MMRFRMAFGGASYGKYATCISKEEYREIMDYAFERKIKLEGFKKFSGSDFATTNRHLISINGDIFNNREYLENEYHMLAEMETFVKGTSYRSVIRHEVGHVVANIYGWKPMDIAKIVLQTSDENDILDYVMNNLSLYAAEYEDGREFISESFSAYYSSVDNPFAEAYVNKCKELAKEVE